MHRDIVNPLVVYTDADGFTQELDKGIKLSGNVQDRNDPTWKNTYFRSGVNLYVSVGGFGNIDGDDRTCAREQLIAEAWGLTDKAVPVDKTEARCFANKGAQ